MRIALGADHGGYALKEQLKEVLTGLGCEYLDLGCESTASCDYPSYAAAVGRAVASGQCMYGIAVCTTGVGMSMACNKVDGIRCALISDTLTARLCREHNNANVLALGAGVVGSKLAEEIVRVFLTTPFAGGRHQRRVDLITALERPCAGTN